MSNWPMILAVSAPVAAAIALISGAAISNRPTPRYRAVARLLDEHPADWAYERDLHPLYIRHVSGLTVYILGGPASLYLRTPEGDELLTGERLFSGDRVVIWEAFERWRRRRAEPRLDALLSDHAARRAFHTQRT